jgi:hypothetical protein
MLIGGLPTHNLTKLMIALIIDNESKRVSRNGN